MMDRRHVFVYAEERQNQRQVEPQQDAVYGGIERVILHRTLVSVPADASDRGKKGKSDQDEGQRKKRSESRKHGSQRCPLLNLPDLCARINPFRGRRIQCRSQPFDRFCNGFGVMGFLHVGNVGHKHAAGGSPAEIAVSGG